MAVTIREIARRAGVSPSAVSRALNDVKGVGAKKAARIRKIAEELGYAPDAQARALVTGRVPFMALVVPDVTNPFYPAMARGADEAFHAEGYSLLLLDTSWSRARVRHSLELLTSRRVAGLVMAAPVNGALAASGLSPDALRRSLVLVGSTGPRGTGLPSVDVDDRRGGWLVGRHLVERGWRRVAFISGPKRERASRLRLAGLADAVESVASATFGAWSVASGAEQAAALLGSRKRPDALFAANDLLAIGAMRAAREAGIEVGRDLAIVGYDDIDHVEYLDVPLTTVAQPKVEIGRVAARMLVEAAESRGEARGGAVRLEPSLVIRESCGGARG